MKSSKTGKKNDVPVNIVLVLQGGGALGAYQAGVYDALSSTQYHPHWIAGVSIGAINASLIAGNPPERRVERLHEFWHRVSSHLVFPAPGLESPRTWFNMASAAFSTFWGVPGFYQPRGLHEMFGWPFGMAPSSFYDTKPLRKTLEELIDFKLINSGNIRLSLGAVEVDTGNSIYFDNTKEEICPEHVMASGALPPAFAPIQIDGKAYWDGGIVSNTPLHYVLDHRHASNRIILQVDLFSAHGDVPTQLSETLVRHKDIMYSSRTRYNTTMLRSHENMRQALSQLLACLPDDMKHHPAVTKLKPFAAPPQEINIVHLIHRPPAPHLDSKDYEFSRASVQERWDAGCEDMRYCLDHPDWLKRTEQSDAVTTYDLCNPEPSKALQGVEN